MPKQLFLAGPEGTGRVLNGVVFSVGDAITSEVLVELKSSKHFPVLRDLINRGILVAQASQAPAPKDKK